MTSVDLFEYDGTIRVPDTSDAATPESKSDDKARETQEQPSFEEEVTQVFGQLGRFWGGVRKQSITAFATARKDLGSVVVSAQKELGRLTEPHPPQPEPSPPADPSTAAPAESSATAEGSSESNEPQKRSESPPPTIQDSVSATATQFFNRIQSSIPANLSTSLQHRLQEAQANPTITQVRSSIAAGIEKIQEQTKGLSLAQAEEIVQHHGEVLLKEASDFFREAVKIIPPDSTTSQNAIWDGSESWMFDPGDTSSGAKEKGKQLYGRRVDVLLHRLRTEDAILLLDPADDANIPIRDSYIAWSKLNIPEDGGSLSESWRERREAALAQGDGTLKGLFERLVPSQLAEDIFWNRYFFRVYEIEQDEEKRKALLQNASAQDAQEDFSWEDEEDETTSMATSRVQAPREDSSTPTKTNPESEAKGASQTTSPRLSEDSYDHLSQASGLRSRTSPGSSVAGAAEAKPEKAKEEDDEDSDWE